MRNLPPKAVIAMIHTLALPGSPYFEGNLKAVVLRAIEDLKIYEAAGVDAVILENMHDLPYAKPPLAKETVEAMLLIAKALRQHNDKIIIGIQLLEAADLQALEIAAKADLDFVRAECFVFAHVGPAGLIEGTAGPLLRLRKKLNAEHIKIFSDVKKRQHGHALTADLTFKDVLKQIEYFRADGIIITSNINGEAAKPADFAEIKGMTKLPIFAGSGITPETINEYGENAAGFIVGSYFKVDNNWQSRLSPEKVKSLIDKIR